MQHAVLLAAGRGTRLGALTEVTPKCLLQINGRALIDRQLDALAEAGIDEVVVVAGFMADAVAKHVGNRCRVLVNESYATTNSVTSLALAAEPLHGRDFLIQNGDTLYPTNLIRRLCTAPRANACLVDSVLPYRPGEYHVEMSEGRIVQYSNAIPPQQSAGESAQLVRIGAGDSVAFFDRIANLISTGHVNAFPNRAFDVLMKGDGLWPIFTAGLPWWEIDTADDLARCNTENGVIPKTNSHRNGTAPFKTRISKFIRSPHAPAWLPPTLGAFFRNPPTVVKAINSFRGDGLSLDGLDLSVNGARFLRLALAEANAVGMHPFLLWGTLLGCIRFGGFIKNDGDLDLGIMADEAALLPQFKQRMARHGFRVRFDLPHKFSLVHPRHPHLFIDIDIIKPHRDGFAITNINYPKKLIFTYPFAKDIFAEIKSAAFAANLSVPVPNDPEGFLKAVYGDWRTPASKVDYWYGPLNTEVELNAKVE